jgi:hypothetical protein
VWWRRGRWRRRRWRRRRRRRRRNRVSKSARTVCCKSLVVGAYKLKNSTERALLVMVKVVGSVTV